MIEPVRSVYEATLLLKQLVQDSPELARLTVRGEVSNISRPASGHLYFTLKDERARLRVVMFAGKARFLRFAPRDGMSVIVQGAIDIFERSGDYQLYADAVQPDGLGALYLAYEQLKERLQAEGLFEHGRKRALPPYPGRIALVTSGTGAAVRDMITTLARRYPLARVLVVPVAVQGEEAPRQIAEGIALVSKWRLADVMIVGRGGGSFEELFAFNTEAVARAIADSAVPVVSAVGHETDTTIADFVADVRAATPTAAAELATADARDIEVRLANAEHRLQSAVAKTLIQCADRVERLSQSRVLAEPGRTIFSLHEQVDALERGLGAGLRTRVDGRVRAVSGLELRLARQSPAARLGAQQARVDALASRQSHALRRVFDGRETRLARAATSLELLSPLAVMKRGYAVVMASATRRAVTGVNGVQPGDAVYVQLRDGWLDCQVWGVHDDDEAES
ncbi:MAG: exodeoxyribonuclease VII large subunit [Bacilli bacterium]